MKKIKERKKETLENIEKFSKELQLLNQRINLVSKEIAHFQGEFRLLERMEKEEVEDKKNKSEK